MTVARTIREAREIRQGLGRVAFVPTMGALHEGHLRLIEVAREAADHVVVSLFVNPTQFGPNDDFSKYPRDELGDLEKAQTAGAIMVFVPSVEEMYASSQVSVKVGGVSELYEGAIRPGHFDGVATVVLKLFSVVRPDVAVFGLKDLQQCAVIEALIRDFDLEIELKLVETVRDERGLALSSRNKYLSPEDQIRASALFGAISEFASNLPGRMKECEILAEDYRRMLSDKGFTIEYLDIVSRRSMRPSRVISDDTRVIVAARFNGVRLIDNVPIVMQD